VYTLSAFSGIDFLLVVTNLSNNFHNWVEKSVKFEASLITIDPLLNLDDQNNLAQMYSDVPFTVTVFVPFFLVNIRVAFQEFSSSYSNLTLPSLRFSTHFISSSVVRSFSIRELYKIKILIKIV